jgi:3-deoxy-D-manno-octulosonic-acid transferase
MTPPALVLYRTATTLLAPFAERFLTARARRGKEDRARLGERTGVASLPRPDGRLVWLHGASIGEGLVLLPLINQLVARGMHALVTTGTKSSASVVGARLPAGAFHQYIPLDAPQFVARFLAHWRPDLAIFAESELWPNLIFAAHERATPVVLVNARISPRSYQRWRMAPGAARALLQKIDVAFAQSQDDAVRLIRLGAPRVHVVGNLKYDVAAPPAAPDELAELVAQIGARPVWIAGSTHPGEEEICLAAHRSLQTRHPSLLTILAPRDARRGEEVERTAEALGLQTARRSANQPIEPATQVYVADTFGDMGLWYRLSDIVFMGKSLVNETIAATGGQNPIEPAKLGAAILHGPATGNFAEAYSALDAANGGATVATAGQLADRLEALFSDVARARAMARAAAGVVGELCGATDRVMQAIEPYLMHMIVDGER